MGFKKFGVYIRLGKTKITFNVSFLIVAILASAIFKPDFDHNGYWWVAVFTSLIAISTLVHEAGHALALKMYGIPSRIELAWIGGATIRNGFERQKPSREIIVSIAGPIFGVVFGLLLHVALRDSTSEMGEWLRAVSWIVNIWWSGLNLLPILPLDGGHISANFFELARKGLGYKIAASISIALTVITTFLIWKFDRDTPFLWIIAAAAIGINIMFLELTPKQRATIKIRDACDQIQNGQPAEGIAHLELISAADSQKYLDDHAMTTWAYGLLQVGRFDELEKILSSPMLDNRRHYFQAAVSWFRGDIDTASSIVAQQLAYSDVDPPPGYLQRTFTRIGERDHLVAWIDSLPLHDKQRAFDRFSASSAELQSSQHQVAPSIG